jgi:selenocysteine-specific elongation factor
MHVIGTAGHVDHGKSTLVTALTGIDPDRFAEEKQRGLTIDLGFAWLGLPSGREVGIVDVPGHERFIKNMLAGAGGINICLFVVAANEGWMPQSAEHLAILDILDVRAGVVALTKADTVDNQQLEIVTKEVQDRLHGTTLEGAAIVPCAAPTGAGMDDLVAELDLLTGTAPPAADVGRPRLWVDRVFTIAGAGTVVTGTLAGGSIAVGDSVELAPSGRKARVRTIQSHKKEVASIGPGNRVALNLAGLEREGAARGDAIVMPGRGRATRRVDVVLRTLPGESTGTNNGITTKGAHLLYAGSAEVAVRIKLLETDRIAPGERGYAQLSLSAPLPLGRGDRFVLRDAGRVLTLGGGRVLDPLPLPARRTDSGRVTLLERLEDATDEDALIALVDTHGVIERTEALVRSGAARADRGVTALGSVLVSDGELERLAEVVRAALRAHHERHPLEAGMARSALRGEVEVAADALDDLLARMDDITAEGAAVRLSSHRIQLSSSDEAARTRVLEQLEGAGFTPPLAKELDIEPGLLRALVDGGELVKVGDFFLTRAQAGAAATKVRERIETEGPVTVADIRDLLGTTRKYAVPLCEWLDATGVTRRRGDLRTLGS